MEFDGSLGTAAQFRYREIWKFVFDRHLMDRPDRND